MGEHLHSDRVLCLRGRDLCLVKLVLHRDVLRQSLHVKFLCKIGFQRPIFPVAQEALSEIALCSKLIFDAGRNPGKSRSVHHTISFQIAQRMRQHARLKRLVADLSLDKDMLQSVIRKNSLGS